MRDLVAHHLLFTLFLFGILAANHACDQNDQVSLLSFPFNTSSPPLNWSSIDCCRWEGISCDQNGKVTRIWLPSRHLKGSVSPFLGNLTRLTHLNLSHNSFSGAVPTGFFSSLNQLKILDLSYNYLGGDISLMFSSNGSSTGWPTSIQILDMSSNNFNGMMQSSFLLRAWNLIKLNVSNNSFTGPIPSSLCINSPFVRLLDFSHNHYSGQIPNGLGGCSELEVLRAGFNSLSRVLPHDIHNATRLEEISLPSNYLSGPISNDVVNLTKLTNLELYGNNFSGKLPVNIGNLSKLKYLLLHMNFLTGSLPPSLMNCTNLSKLNLWFNFFEGNISTYNFSSLHQLSILDIGRNNFTGSLPVSLYSCKSLRAIRLSRNQLEGQILPEVLQLKFLSFLSLGHNRLTNITGAIQILLHCKNLNIIFLEGNFLHEKMPGDDLVVGFDGFKNLRALNLADSQLTGQLPIWLSKLRNLETLDLSFNRITGSIPDWLSTLPRLFRLDLSNNLISGEFPKEFCLFPALISPKAPRDDIYLYLPIFIIKNGALLQYNSLSNLQPKIYISNNNLSGNIPIEIGRLKQLHMLGLSHNNLSGNIPNQISELTNLEILDLSRNQLLGEIPASLTSMHFLSNFSVANNNLQGPIPSSTQLQSFEASAYEGNPRLCGPPLPNGCVDIVSSKVDKDIQDDENWLGMPWFLVSVVLGFFTGFWGVLGSLLCNYNWRVAYFQFLDNVKKRLYVTLGMCFTGLHIRL
ncbi:receptor-like protein 2 [Corylus avellana]|uniref:receptor-like protein 2 n=1 Tax=Corylus avellana TaxID=13451 RepID=UPI00286A047A|nr:receptor-like protein 2 [Corylus avellana]